MTEIEWWEMTTRASSRTRSRRHPVRHRKRDRRARLRGHRTRRRQDPLPGYEKLASVKLDWKRVTIVPGDERIVPLGDPLSNVTQLGKLFIPKGARVIPIVPKQTEDYKSAGRSADALMQDLHWPLDCACSAWVATGIPPRSSPAPISTRLNGPKERRMLGVMPDPLPPEARSHASRSSRQGIVTARALMIALTGKDKRKVLETGDRTGPSSPYPIGASSPMPSCPSTSTGRRKLPPTVRAEPVEAR